MAEDQASKISICNLTEVFGVAQEQTLNTEACGCEIYTVRTEGALYIHYCPLHARAGEMREMLKEVEWIEVDTGVDGTARYCPSCLYDEEDGHRLPCKLQTLLKEINDG